MSQPLTVNSLLTSYALNQQPPIHLGDSSLTLPIINFSFVDFEHKVYDLNRITTLNTLQKPKIYPISPTHSSIHPYIKFLKNQTHNFPT